MRCILVADLHLSHKPPISRSVEEDWYGVQKRYLDQLTQISKQCGHPNGWHGIPIVIAGDIFDKWNPPIELVNFALDNLPISYAIPGNHDLPNHNYSEIRKTAYWTLVRAGVVIPLHPGTPVLPHEVIGIRLHGFPYGFPVKPLQDRSSLLMDIAVVHSYIWTKTTGFPGAPEDKRAKTYFPNLEGYDIAAFGDNHIPFKITRDKQTIINCGSLLRRNIDQQDYYPAVWLVRSDNTVERRYLDTSGDKFLDTRKLEKITVGGVKLVKFLENMRDIKDSTISYEEAITNYLRKHKVAPEIQRIILSAMEGL